MIRRTVHPDRQSTFLAMVMPAVAPTLHGEVVILLKSAPITSNFPKIARVSQSLPLWRTKEGQSESGWFRLGRGEIRPRHLVTTSALWFGTSHKGLSAQSIKAARNDDPRGSRLLVFRHDVPQIELQIFTGYSVGAKTARLQWSPLKLLSKTFRWQQPAVPCRNIRRRQSADV